jgi:NAD(P) transhydrogenase
LNHEVDVLEHQFARNGVKAALGTARFLTANTLEITSPQGETHLVEAAKILIAVGTRPHRPASIPFDGTSVFDSDDIVEHIHLPRSLTVIGAGVIGVEYATIYSALDVAVTLVEPQPKLPQFRRFRNHRGIHASDARAEHHASPGRQGGAYRIRR